MALPGAVLPALLSRLSLGDSQAGLLFFLGWMGTSLGALVVRPPVARSVAVGCSLVAIGALGMAWGVDAIRWSCFVWMTIYGLGLGIAMTATSLLQAARHADKRGTELNRLNLIWAIGACICPSLAAHSLRIANVRVIFSALGLFFALVCVWVLAFEHDPETSSARQQLLGKRFSLQKLSMWPLPLVLMIFLPTGIESSMGGWTAAYVQRTQQTIAATVTASSCFWGGLLFSRMLSSSVLSRMLSERWVLIQSLCTVVFGAVLLIASTSTLGILSSVFLVGFGLGPIYPLLLAIALQYSENTTIFFCAGLGSAFLPWLTGMVSSASTSLRVGLFVPLAASILMLILGIRLLAIDNVQVD